jgi:predicted 3-demethylubiquinone-9 3-methyltransferase (glyoxalase superfamily)
VQIGQQKITPFLWFDNQAEDAARFYTSIFKNSKFDDGDRDRDAGPGTKETVMSVTFELEGQPFIALNGGPLFTFSPAISFFVRCEHQDEVDELWEKLSDGGEKGQCGWLIDKYGVSWQIVPAVLGELLNDEVEQKANRVMSAMLQMHKLDIGRLQEAALASS